MTSVASDRAARLPHKAVLWAATGNFDGNGNPTFAAPIEIDSRWEFSVAMQQSSDKAPVTDSNTVFVDREITQGSKLWQGKLADLPVGFDTANAVACTNYREIADIKGRRAQRTVTIQ